MRWCRSASLCHAPRRQALTYRGGGDLSSGPLSRRDSPSPRSSTPTADGPPTYLCRACLEKSPETRDAVGRHTLALTTYMGHACVSDTYWYLETTPQLMTAIATACDTFMH